MILSRNTRIVLNTLLTYEEDMVNRFYSVSMLESKIRKPIRVVDVLNDLNEMGLLQWGDKQHTAFRISERARSYKEIQRLEKWERWKERLIGFVSGVVLTVIAWLLSTIV